MNLRYYIRMKPFVLENLDTIGSSLKSWWRAKISHENKKIGGKWKLYKVRYQSNGLKEL